MALTFAAILEAMERNQHGTSPLMDSGEESRSVRCVRSGNALRDEDDGSFWEEFISLCGDAEGLASLLGVRREQVAHWPDRIRRARQKVDMHDNMPEEKPEEKQEMLPTGENGALTREKMGPHGPIGGL